MSAMLKELIQSFILQVVSGIGGLKGFALKYVLKFGGQYLFDLYEKWQKDSARKVIQLEEKKKYEAVINKPDSTVEERAKAYEKYLNSNS